MVFLSRISPLNAFVNPPFLNLSPLFLSPLYNWGVFIYPEALGVCYLTLPGGMQGKCNVSQKLFEENENFRCS